MEVRTARHRWVKFPNSTTVLIDFPAGGLSIELMNCVGCYLSLFINTNSINVLK